MKNSFINKAIAFLEKRLSFKDDEGNDIPLTANDKMNIRDLIKQVVKQFEEGMDEVVGDLTIQFPMVFDILLCTEDYNRLEQAIPAIFPELVSRFYGIIKTKRDNVRGAVVSHTNKYWLFTYSASDGYPDENGNFVTMEKGKVTVQAYLYGEDIRNINVGNSTDTRSSRSSRVSTRSTTTNGSFSSSAFNIDVLRGGMLHANQAVSFDFDPEMNQDLDTIRGAGNKREEAFAVLTWRSEKTNKGSDKPFMMKENTVTISGPSDTRTNNPSGILIVDDDTVAKDHVQIKYVKDKNGFEICAFSSDVRVNSFPVAVSQGQDIAWMALSRKSTILIKDNVRIDFAALI